MQRLIVVSGEKALTMSAPAVNLGPRFREDERGKVGV
jgi:hypothetical protein